VGAVELFPNAQFIVSDVELKFALNPTPCLYASYEALQLGIQPLFLKVINRLKTIDMSGKEIAEGVRTIPLPGHSPGGIGVVVDTDNGPYVIAGDAVPTYRNLQGEPQNNQPYIMSGVYTDMEAMWKSFELIMDIVKGDIYRVIPGHEPLVFNKERYP
jgi:glyoxylase-like metal-dependent hydrolase (beta-lactamase superfamily II)